MIPVSALIEVSETPNRTPEAAPSITPWCSTGPPIRGPMINRPPSPNRPASKEIITACEKCECAPCIAGSVKPSSTRPAAVSHSPSHCRRPTRKPNRRSAMTAINTTPPASATWTTDIGASVSAATCRPQRRRRDDHPQREPLRGEQLAARAQRVAHADPRHLPRAAVLVEEAEVRHEGAGEREEYAEIKCHGECVASAATDARLHRQAPGVLYCRASIRAD